MHLTIYHFVYDNCSNARIYRIDQQIHRFVSIPILKKHNIKYVYV